MNVKIRKYNDIEWGSFEDKCTHKNWIFLFCNKRTVKENMSQSQFEVEMKKGPIDQIDDTAVLPYLVRILNYVQVWTFFLFFC